MKLSKISEELHDRIILVAYGSASFLEKRRIEKLASENESVQKLLDEYKSSANLVHSIPIEKYSGKLNGQIITNSSKSILDYIYQIIVGRPAIIKNQITEISLLLKLKEQILKANKHC